MWKYNQTEELYHWGVLGMKWGHRKAQIKSSLEYRDGRRKFNLQQKWNKQEKNKQNQIKDVDSRINKYGSVSKFKNINRAKMVGLASAGAAGTVAIGTGAAIRRMSTWVNPTTGKLTSSMQKLHDNMKLFNMQRASKNPIIRLRGERAYKNIIKSKEFSKVENDIKKIGAATLIGATVVGAIVGKKIYNKHKENKIANDYEYRKYLKKNKQIKRK